MYTTLHVRSHVDKKNCDNPSNVYQRGVPCSAKSLATDTTKENSHAKVQRQQQKGNSIGNANGK